MDENRAQRTLTLLLICWLLISSWKGRITVFTYIPTVNPGFSGQFQTQCHTDSPGKVFFFLSICIFSPSFSFFNKLILCGFHIPHFMHSKPTYLPIPSHLLSALTTSPRNESKFKRKTKNLKKKQK